MGIEALLSTQIIDTTTVGRAVMTAADAAAARTAIGAGTSSFSGAYSALSGIPSTFAPSAHKTSHATGGSDALTAADIGAAATSHTHAAAESPMLQWLLLVLQESSLIQKKILLKLSS